MDIIQHSFIWNRFVNRLLLGKEQKMKCEDCSHAEMCKWIDELEGRGCDFGEPCDDAISRETIEDIKAEIYKERTNISFNLSEEKSKWVNSGIYDGLVWAEEIIDKHIEGR